MEPTIPTAPTRAENDLDSITVGSDSTAKIKIYFNSREDSEANINLRIQTAVKAEAFLRNRMSEEGLTAGKKQ
jgi:hypothetical protein